MLNRLLALSAALVLVAPAARSAQTAPEESCYLMLLNGQPSGYLLSRSSAAADGGVETTIETSFKMKRMGSEVAVTDRTTTVEGADGRILRMTKRLAMSAAETIYEGTVADGRLEITTRTLGKPVKSSIEWPADVPGPEETRRRLLASGFTPGAVVTVRQFDFTLGDVFEMRHEVQGEETLELPDGRRRLIRILATPDLPGLPAVTSWHDQDGRMVRTAMKMMGMEFVTEVADRARVAALKDGGGAGVEVFLDTVLRSNVRLPRPRSLTSVLYRITPREGADLPGLEDERQKVVAQEDGAVLLEVSLVLPPDDRRQRRPLEGAAREIEEFLVPSAMVQSDAAAIVELARRTVGDERDAWRAACLLEQEVYRTIDKKSMDVAFASALEVLETRRGDCTEHAVLLAALCRAAGVPARVAMGVEYVGGVFGGHAWTEVSVDGRWYALDATFGRGAVDPTHLRFGWSSLVDGGFSGALLGIMRAIGAFDLEIVSFDLDGRRVTVADAAAATAAAPDTEGGRFHDPILGVGFAIPAGWRLERVENPGEALAARQVVARLAAPGGATLTLVELQVPYDFTLERITERWRQRAGHEDLPVLVRTLAGRDGRLAVASEAEAPFGAAAVLIADSVYHLEASDAEEATLDAFLAVLDSLEIH